MSDLELNAASIDAVVKQLVNWRDTDEPMVEAIGNTLAEYHRADSQELSRRVLDAVIEVLEHHAESMR
ncbi:MAG TPA: hypothetical protein VFZ72_18165 [Jiangellaceae bacterium]